jgi:hypothetical protein
LGTFKVAREHGVRKKPSEFFAFFMDLGRNMQEQLSRRNRSNTVDAPFIISDMNHKMNFSEASDRGNSCTVEPINEG